MPGIEVVSATDSRLDPPYPGLYQGSGVPILVAPALTYSVKETTRHELCHAVDNDEGIVTGQEDLFPEAGDSYLGDPAEQFAYVCQEDPRDLALAWPVHGACGDAALAAQERFVAEDVLASGRPGARVTGPIRSSIERRAVEFPWDSAPLAVAASAGRGLAVGVEPSGGALALLVVDPSVGEEWTLDLAPSVDSSSSWAMVADDTRAYVFSEERGGGAWQVDLEERVAVEIPSPPTASGSSSTRGTVVAGGVWILDAGLRAPELLLWDPATGHALDRAVIEPLRSARFAPAGMPQAVGILAEGTRVWLAAYDGMLAFDTRSREWRHLGKPSPSSTLYRLTRAGDLLLTYVMYAGEPHIFLLLLDPATGEWIVPTDPCVENSVEWGPMLVEDGGVATMWDTGPYEWPTTRDEWFFSTIEVAAGE